MDNIELKVIKLIPYKSKGRITHKSLAKMLDIKSRTLYDVIYRLRTKYHMPILASREIPTGYYLAENYEDIARGIIPLKSQYTATRKVIAGIERADFEDVQRIKGGIE